MIILKYGITKKNNLVFQDEYFSRDHLSKAYSSSSQGITRKQENLEVFVGIFIKSDCKLYEF